MTDGLYQSVPRVATPFHAGLATLASTDPNAPDAPCGEWLDMASRWDLPNDLLQGTLHMRSMGEKWLPREKREDTSSYHHKVMRSVLFEGYKNALNRICKKPFSKEVSLKGELPDELKAMVDNIDREGTKLTSFAYELMCDGVNSGLTHILVDFPKHDEGRTLADQRQQGIRPYFTHVKAQQLIGWTSEVMPNGERMLTQIRIRETVHEPEGMYGSRLVDQIKVVNIGSYSILRKADGEKNFTEYMSGEMRKADGSLWGRIPLVTVYFNRQGYMCAYPPLEDLAWINLAHWQSHADHRNYLRFIRIGILTAAGFADEEIEKGIVIKPNGMVTSSSKDAKLSYVEHSGEAYQAGLDDLEMLRRDMETLGTTPLIEGSANSTATGRIIDEGGNDAMAQAWVRALEAGLEHCFELAAMWIGETTLIDEMTSEEAEDREPFAVDIFSEFALAKRSTHDIDRLIKIRQHARPDITHSTFIDELRRRGLLAETVDAADEAEGLSEEMISTLSNAIDASGGTVNDNDPDDEGAGD